MPQTELLDLKVKLKKLYKLQNTLPKLIEDPDIKAQSLEDYYVKMQIILKEKSEANGAQNILNSYDKIEGTKKAIGIENLFAKIDDEHPEMEKMKRLLIVGGAGIGKTTLLHYVAYKWSGESGLWNDKFDYVLKVKLKKLGTVEWDRGRGAKEDLAELIVQSLNMEWSIAKLNKKDGFKKEEIDLMLGNKERVLLLMDGYDEVAHLASNADHIASEIIGEIFTYPNVVITSRPNARLIKVMKFERKVENIGLDLEGITRYVKIQFKETKDLSNSLQDFLKSNHNVQAMCTVPINIAMLSLIWSNPGTKDKFTREFRITDLYQEVILWLGKRYINKFRNENHMVHLKKFTSLSSIQEITDNDILSLEEVKFLKKVAYKSFVSSDKLAVSFALVEKTKESYKQLLIDMVDKYGLLRPEGDLNNGYDCIFMCSQKPSKLATQKIYLYLEDDNLQYAYKKYEGDTIEVVIIKKADLTTKAELTMHNAIIPLLANPIEQRLPDKYMADFSEFALKYGHTHLKQNRYFVHLTFQEYLTACYLKEKLLNSDNLKVKEVVEFIAKHRNEPRYLMTLKFLAGLISNEDNETIVKIFWEAITCNIDGVLELGIETKVTLWMNLIEQTKKIGKVDDRIPNIKLITNLIDVVVLENLLDWEQQIISSGYFSDNMKEILLVAILDDNWALNIEKIGCILQETKLKPAIFHILKKAAQNVALGAAQKAAIEILKANNTDVTVNVKLTEEEIKILNKSKKIRIIQLATRVIVKLADKKEELFSKMLLLLQEENDWQIQSAAISCITEIIKISPEKLSIQKHTIRKICSFIANRNLKEQAKICLIELSFTYITNVIEGLLNLMESSSDFDTKQAIAQALGEIIKVGGNNVACMFCIPSIVSNLFELMISSRDRHIQRTAAYALAETVKVSSDKVVTLTKIIDDLFNLAGNDAHDTTKQATADALGKVINASDGNIDNLTYMITILLEFKENYLLNSFKAAYVLREVVKANNGKVDGITYIINGLLKFIKSSDNYDTKLEAFNALGDAGNMGGSKVVDLTSMVTILFTCIENSSDKYTKQVVADALIKASKAGTSVIKGLLNLMESSGNDDDTKLAATKALSKAASIRGGDFDGLVDVIKGLLNLMESSGNDDVKAAAVYALGEAVKTTSCNCYPLIDIIDSAFKLMKSGSSEYSKKCAVNTLVGIGMLDDIKLTRIINGLLALMKEGSSDNTKLAANALGETVKASSCNPDKLFTIIAGLFELVKNHDDSNTKEIAARIIILAGKAGINKVYNMNYMIDILLKLMEENIPNDMKHTAADILSKTIMVSGSSIVSLDKIIERSFAALQNSSDKHIQQAIANILIEISKASENKVVIITDMINRLLELIETSDHDNTKQIAADALGEIVEIGGNSITFDEIINIIKGLFKAIESKVNDDTKQAATNTLTKAVKVYGYRFDGLVGIIKGLFNLIESSDNEYTKVVAANALIEIGKASDGTFRDLVALTTVLLNFIESGNDEYAKQTAIYALHELAKASDANGRVSIITGLFNLMKSSSSEYNSREKMAEALIKVIEVSGKKNDNLTYIIDSLLDLMVKPTNVHTKQIAAHILSKAVKVTIGNVHNLIGIINALLEAIENGCNNQLKWTAAYALGEVLETRVDVVIITDMVSRLLELIKTSDNGNTKQVAAFSLGEVVEKSKIRVDDIMVGNIIKILFKLTEDNSDDDTKQIMVEDALIRIVKASDITLNNLIVVINGLLELIKNSNDKTKAKVANALGEAIKAGGGKLEKTIYMRIINGLFELMKSSINDYTKRAAADTLGDVVKTTGNDVDTLTCIIKGLFELIERDSNNHETKAVAANAIRNTIMDSYIIQPFIFFNHKNKFIRDCIMQALTKKLAKIHLEETKLGALETINICFELIGYQHDDSNSDSKELKIIAKTLLYKQIICIRDDELSKINNKFEEFLYKSIESKRFFQKLYQEILSNQIITENKKEFIVKCINHGFTTSINKDGHIMFNGVSYELKDDVSKGFLEEIAQSILNQKDDLLAVQYNSNQPLFANDGSTLMVAASDIKDEAVISLLGKGKDGNILSKNRWLLSLVRTLDADEEFVLLEKRSLFGDRIIYKITAKSNGKPNVGKDLVIHPYGDTREFRKELFGKSDHTQYIAITIMCPLEVFKNVLKILNDCGNLFSTVERIAADSEKYKLDKFSSDEYESNQLIYNIDKLTLLKMNVDSEEAKFFKLEEESKKQQAEIDLLKKESLAVRNRIRELNIELEDAEIDKIAKNNVAIKEFKKNEKLYNYYSTFYWTFSNYLHSYRNMSTGMLQGTGAAEGSDTVNTLSKIGTGLGIAGTLVGSAPLIGNIAGTIIGFMQSAAGFAQGRAVDEAIRSVNNIIKSFYGTETLLANDIALLAVKLTEIKKDEILNPKIEQDKVSTIKRLFNKIIKNIETVKLKLKITEKLTEEQELAIQDVGFIMTILVKNTSSLEVKKVPANQLHKDNGELSTQLLALFTEEDPLKDLNEKISDKKLVDLADEALIFKQKITVSKSTTLQYDGQRQAMCSSPSSTQSSPVAEQELEEKQPPTPTVQVKPSSVCCVIC